MRTSKGGARGQKRRVASAAFACGLPRSQIWHLDRFKKDQNRPGKPRQHVKPNTHGLKMFSNRTIGEIPDSS